MTRELLVVGNAKAGPQDREAVHAAAGRLAETCTVRLEWTEDADDLGELVSTCDTARIVSAGGDGSVSALVSALIDCGRPDIEVAVLPLGTGNDVAGALGLSDLDAALAAAAGDRTAQIDLLDSSHGIVLNALHLGIGAVAAQRASALKRPLGRIAYPVGALVTGMGSAEWPIRVEVDGELVADGPMALVALTNGYRVGGGFPLAPGARHGDGTIDVVVAEATGAGGRARLAWAGRRGRAAELPFVHRCEGRRVQVVTKGAVAANRDGELFEVDGHLDARIMEGAVTICLVP